MLRMVLAGLLIPLGIGVLAAMELNSPPRTTVAAAPPLADIAVDLSGAHAALAKADRLEFTYANSEPTQPALIDGRVSSPPEAAAVSPPEASPASPPKPPRIVKHHRHDPKPRKVASAALPKSKPKSADVKRTATPDRPKAVADAAPCRLSAFGGLRKALNLSACEI